MTIKTRRAVFYSLCAVFAAVGTIAVFYAQGWRLDTESFRFQKVGGLYLKSFPKDAGIYLNGKYVDKKPGLLDSGRFVGNLLPKNYSLEFKSDGYLPWSEHVQVNPSLVTEVKYAVMIPEVSSPVSENADGFWADSDQLITSSGGYLRYNGAAIKGTEVVWQDHVSKTALTRSASGQNYYLYDLSGEKPTSTSANKTMAAAGIRLSSINEISKDPLSNGRALIITASRIFTLDAKTGNVSLVASSTQTMEETAASPSFAAWVTQAAGGSSVIHFRSRSSDNESRTEMDGTAAKIFFRNGNELGVLLDNGSFYMVSSDGKAEPIASDVRSFSFSQKGNMVSLLENQAIEIFSFDAEKDYWRFRLPDNQSVRKLEWYSDENNLFVFYPSEIKMLNLDDKSIENFRTVALSGNGTYDPASNTLYFFNNKEPKKIVFPQ